MQSYLLLAEYANIMTNSILCSPIVMVYCLPKKQSIANIFILLSAKLLSKIQI